MQHCDSTMLLAWGPRAAHGEAWQARHQRGGYGRRGRAWASKAHLGVWWSCRLSLPAGVAVATLPLLAAVLARRLLASLGLPVLIKWPNDLLLHGRKVAGILVEARSGADAMDAVVGIGINLQPPPALAGRLHWPAGGIVGHLPGHLGHDDDGNERLRRDLGQLLLEAFAGALPRWLSGGWPPFAAQLQDHLALVGELAWVHQPGRSPWLATILGVTDDGQLRARDEHSQQQLLLDGELSVLPAARQAPAPALLPTSDRGPGNA